MNKSFIRVAILLFLISQVATLGASACLASITLNMTEGYIDLENPNGLIEISLLGYDSNDLPFVFNAFANNTVNHLETPTSPLWSQFDYLPSIQWKWNRFT